METALDQDIEQCSEHTRVVRWIHRTEGRSRQSLRYWRYSSPSSWGQQACSTVLNPFCSFSTAKVLAGGAAIDATHQRRTQNGCRLDRQGSWKDLMASHLVMSDHRN